MRLHLLLAGLLLGGSIGCASLNRHSEYQSVAVTSEPPGANVEVEGRSVGKTPTFVLIERDRHPSPIKVGSKEVPLVTRYRWGASFGNGFALAMFAPISWGIDFLTGAAWEIKDPSPVKFENASSRSTETIRTVVIAPPVAESLALSELGARAFEKHLSSNPHGMNLKSYDQTLPVFLAERFDFDGGGTKEDRRTVAAKLGADAIYFSQVEESDDEYVLKSELKDSFTDKTIESHELTLSSDSQIAKVYGRGRSLFKFVPNTVGLSLMAEAPRYTLGNEEIKLVSAGGDQWWEQGLQYLSSISLTNQPVYRSGRGARWQYSFVPAIRASAKNLKATGSTLVDGQVFSRWLLFGGYGVEGGYQFGRHYIYASLIPGFTWSQISWQRNGASNSVANTSLTAQSELGYLWAFTDMWSMRLFAGSYAENTDAWSEALRRTANQTNADFGKGNASTAVAGIVIGYCFESVAKESYKAVRAKKF